MFRKHIDLVSISIVAIAGILLNGFGPVHSSWLSIFGILLTMVLPGYVVSRLILPDLRRAERVLISLALSIVIVGLSGILLDLLPWGLRPATWSIWLGLITLVGAFLLAWRNEWPVRTWPWLRATVIDMSRSFNWRVALLFGLAFALVALSFALANQYTASLATPLTNLWAGNDPSDPEMVVVGVQNFEDQPMTYNIVLLQDGKDVGSLGPVTLDDGKTLTGKVALKNVSGSMVKIILYKSQDPEVVYREVNVFMPVPSEGVSRR